MDSHANDRVASIVRQPVVTASVAGTLREVAEILRDAEVGVVVLVNESQQPCGVISERDIVRALADGAQIDRVAAAVVMSEEPRYATPGQSVRSAAREMLAAGCRHLPVVEDGELVGIVSARDALQVLADAGPAREDGLTDGGRAVERELAHPGG